MNPPRVFGKMNASGETNPFAEALAFSCSQANILSQAGRQMNIRE